MPAATIKSTAKKTGKSEQELEKLWKKAKKAAEDQGRKDDFAYITGIFKKMAGLKENYYIIDIVNGSFILIGEENENK